MSSDSSRFPLSNFREHAELELLHLVLQESETYPWNPAEQDAEAYFADLEQEVMAAGWLEEDLMASGQVLAQTLNQMWDSVAPTVAVQDSVAQSLSAELFQRFTAQVPQTFLESIVQRARALVSNNQSLADQLVACVSDLLPEWGNDDLQVLARPFAYAMRGGETEMLEAALRSVRCAAWTELSGIEQARLSLAIARYALSQQLSHGVDPR
jgi:hypothetical protein